MGIIGEASSHTKVIDPKIMEVFPLAVRYPPVDFIKISDTYDVIGSSESDIDGFEGLYDEENLESNVKEYGGENSFRLNIREVGCGFAFPDILIVNLNTIWNIRMNWGATICTKVFKHLDGREPSDNEVRQWLEHQFRSRTHGRDFLLVDCKEDMIRRGHLNPELLVDADQYTLMERTS